MPYVSSAAKCEVGGLVDNKLERLYKKLYKTAFRIVNEAPNHDADEVPDWLDELLGNLSIDVSGITEHKSHRRRG